MVLWDCSVGCIEAMLHDSKWQDTRRALIVPQAHALNCSADLSVWWSGLGPRPRGWPFLRTSSVTGWWCSTQSLGMLDYYAIRTTKKGNGAKHLPRRDKRCSVKRTPITRKMAWHSIYRWGSKKALEMGRKQASLMSVKHVQSPRQARHRRNACPIPVPGSWNPV